MTTGRGFDLRPAALPVAAQEPCGFFRRTAGQRNFRPASPHGRRKIHPPHDLPRHHVAKVYEAVTEEDIPTEAVELFASGTLTLNGETRPCAPALLEIREPRRALLTLTEGKYHQVRRMLAAVGAPVLSLCRVSIGSCIWTA